MATPIIMPKFGQMTEESAIVEWLKKEGDPVAKGDILFTVETDKSVMDVESFEEGTLLKIVVPPRVSVPVQSTVGFLGKPGEAIPAVAAPPSPVATKLAAPSPRCRSCAADAGPVAAVTPPSPPATIHQFQSLFPFSRHRLPPFSASVRARRPWPGIA